MFFHAALVLLLQVMEDVFSNPGSLERMDSLLLSGPRDPDCSLRLCGLQKLPVSSVLSP